jgi:hypothetical protein
MNVVKETGVEKKGSCGNTGVEDMIEAMRCPRYHRHLHHLKIPSHVSIYNFIVYDAQNGLIDSIHTYNLASGELSIFNRCKTQVRAQLAEGEIAS